MAVDENEERLANQLDAICDLPGRTELSVTVLFVHEEIDAPPDEAGSSVIESINEDIDSLQGAPDTVPAAEETLADLGAPVETWTGKGDAASVILESPRTSPRTPSAWPAASGVRSRRRDVRERHAERRPEQRPAGRRGAVTREVVSNTRP